MADKKRAELKESVEDACEGLEECGFGGLLEAPVLKTFTELHKFNDTEQLTKLMGALDGAATRLVSAKSAPTLPELMVLAQLLSDLDGPAAPPEGADSPLSSDFQSLTAHLRLALSVAVLQFGRPGSAEAKEGAEMAAGMLLVLHERVAADKVVTLAVEHALLRMVTRSRRSVVMLRDRTWALAALNTQVAALEEYEPGPSGIDSDDMGDGGDSEDGDDEDLEEAVGPDEADGGEDEAAASDGGAQA